MEETNYIDILLEPKEKVRLKIVAQGAASDINEIDIENARENYEAPYQLKEGCSYEFLLNKKGYKIHCPTRGILSESKIKSKKQRGFIQPNIYVGTLPLQLINTSDNGIVSKFDLEVISKKTSYRKDYRKMLNDITEKSIDLLFLINSPVYQSVQVDYENVTNEKALYQQFSFVKSMVESVEFEESLLRIISNPSTQWKAKEEEKDVRRIKRLSRKEVKQMVHGSTRIGLPNDHCLRAFGLNSISAKVKTSKQFENLDTLENRFVKFVLEEFVAFFQNIQELVHKDSNEGSVVKTIIEKVEEYLSYSIFRECSRLTSVPLNSPVLQRKEGYRVVLKSWLMFDLAAKLGWDGGEDVYGVGKKNIATLYEYWLFFKLLEIVQEVFEVEVEKLEELFSSKNGLHLSLKQGKQLDIIGEYINGKRPLKVKFSFNRTFGKAKKYPLGGSWTKSMKPDYTLSIWPLEFDDKIAEKEELITHIHFDAKYKVDKASQIFGDDTSDDEEEFHARDKIEQQKGNYKRVDLLKMHAYKDAIRRTAGAYVLYPGTEQERLEGFHEILPGLGAFALSPSKDNDGSTKLKSFIKEVLRHIENRATQREKLTAKTYEIHKDEENNLLEEAIPEKIGGVKLIPDETYVLVGYYKDAAHLDWIEKNNLYNRRIDTKRGNQPFEIGDVQAKYLLLHTKGDKYASKIYRIENVGPKVYSSKKMNKLTYPGGTVDSYFIYKLEKVSDYFPTKKWDFKKLKSYKANRGSAFMGTCTLTELMNSIFNE